MRALPIVLLCLSCGGDDSSTGTTATNDAGSTSSSSSGGTSGDDVHQLCIDTINGYRKTKGLPAYTRWSDGETCADGEAESDGQSNTGHGAFPRCKEMAQNECPGIPGPPATAIKNCLALMWQQGPGEGHYEMMASTQWKQVACGFYTTDSGAVWSVQNYR